MSFRGGTSNGRRGKKSGTDRQQRKAGANGTSDLRLRDESSFPRLVSGDDESGAGEESQAIYISSIKNTKEKE
jgi:hypothetical protein